MSISVDVSLLSGKTVTGRAEPDEDAITLKYGLVFNQGSNQTPPTLDHGAQCTLDHKVLKRSQTLNLGI